MPEKEKASLAGEARRGGTIDAVTLPRSLAFVNGAASDAEVAAARAALGAVLQDPAFAWPFVKDLPLERFPLGLERHVAEAMHSLTRRGAPIDLVSVVQEVTDAGVLGACGGAATICELTNAVPTSANIEYYTQRLRELSNPRILGSLLSYSFKKASEPGADVPGITAALVETLTAEFAPSSAAVDWQACDTEAWATEPAPPIAWTFEGMIASGELGGIVSMGGLGKSWLTLMLAYSAATGEALLPSFRPSAPMKVLLLAGEDNDLTLWRRFRSIPGFSRHADLRRENLHVIARQSEPLVELRNGNPCRTARWTWLRDRVLREAYGLVIIDPLARWHSVDENAAPHMTAVVVALETLTSDGATVLFTHHVRKASEESLTSAAARGSTALRDGVRWQANLAEVTESEARQMGLANPRAFVRLDVSKTNNTAALTKPIVFRRGEGGALSEVDIQESRDEAVARFVARWLHENPEAELNYRRLRDGRRSDKAVDDLLTDLRGEFGKKLTQSRILEGVQFGLRQGSLVLKPGSRDEQTVCAPFGVNNE